MLPSDKIGHFLAGIAASALAYPFGAIEAMGVAIVVGVGKEIWDSAHDGQVELADAICTIAGGALLLGWYVFGTGYL